MRQRFLRVTRDSGGDMGVLPHARFLSPVSLSRDKEIGNKPIIVRMICSHSKNFFQKNLIFFKIPVTFCLLVRISSVSATVTRQNAWKQYARHHRAKSIP
jgi:hypothetical protein